MDTHPRTSEFEEQLRRVRQTYRDTPNLRLTPSGLQRLFGLRPSLCVEILEALLGERFLCRTSDGLFVAICGAAENARHWGRRRVSQNDADPL